MIGRLNGKVFSIDGDVVTLDVHGVGYEVVCSRSALARLEVNTEASLPIHTDVREDSIRLFGFDSLAERQVFHLLNRVSGIGPRSSMDVVSNVSVRDLLRAIGSGDVNALTKIRGVGRKKAERMIVELRDLVGNLAGERSSSLRSSVEVESASPTSSFPFDAAFSVQDDAIAALEVLGFSKRDAQSAVESGARALPKAASDVGELVREALRHI